MTSSPYMPPPPRRRSVVGPLILVFLGVVFLLRNFGYTLPLFHYFVRYWPLLLVLIGVVRLAEFFAARRSQRPAPYMGGWAVLLVWLLIVTGLGLTALFHGRNEINWGTLRDNVDVDDDVLHLFGNEYSFDGELTQAATPGGSVHVECDRGNVTVSNWDQPQVKVVYHKRVFASGQGEASRTDKSTMPQLRLNGTTVEVAANTGGAGPKGVATDLELYIPAKTELEITSYNGDVSVSQHSGDVTINTQRGDTTLDQMTGNVSISGHKGSLHVSNLNGVLNVNGRLDDLSLDTISGPVQIAADIFGDTRLSRLKSAVSIRTSRTQLQFARLDGDLTMDSGDLQGDGVQGPLVLTSSTKDVDLRNLRGDIQIKDDHGDISLEMAAPPALGDLDVTTHHGDVHLRIPTKASFQYELATRHGSITNDFGSSKESSESAATNVSGTVGRGGVKVKVLSDTGDIELNKMDKVEPPEPPEPPALPAPPAKPAKPHHSGRNVDDGDVM